MSSNTSRGIPSLDGLRAISIGLVVFAHAAEISKGTAIQRFESRLDLGVLGVRVFFVISGLLITTLLLDEERRTRAISLPQFYFRRLIRIFPAFYFYLAVIALFTLLGWIEVPVGHFVMSAAYLCNYLTLPAWYVGHSWSLSIEEQFYLVWPLLLVLAGRRRAVQGAIAFIVLAPILRIATYFLLPDQQWALDRWFPMVADAIAIGCVMAGYRDRLRAWDRYQRFQRSPLFLVVPLLVCVADAMLVHPLFYYAVSITVMNLGIAMCIDWCIVHRESWIGTILNLRPIRFVGVLSYSIYLWQQLFLTPRDDVFGTLPLVARVLGVVIAPLVSYFLVEKTFLALRGRIERRRRAAA